MIDQLMSALFLLALLLYLVPVSFRLGERSVWFQRGAILTLAIAFAIAIAESIMWLGSGPIN